MTFGEWYSQKSNDNVDQEKWEWFMSEVSHGLGYEKTEEAFLESIKVDTFNRLYDANLKSQYETSN